MSIKDIVTGHYNEFINAQNDLSEERMSICRKCPLLKHTALGPVCNKDLFLNVETNETSTSPDYGLKKGCGCRLNAKTRNPGSHCPLGKW